jgi:hypothetical protein
MKNYQELAQARITKVVRFFTTNPTKVILNFYDFSRIFYGFYKILQMTNTIEVTALQSAPWFSGGSQLCPYFAVRTSERFITLQCHPWGRWPARLAGFRRARLRPRPGEGGEMVSNPQGPNSGGRLALGGGRHAAHRRPAAVAAMSRAAARQRLD